MSTLRAPKFPQYDPRRHGNVFEWLLHATEKVRKHYAPPPPVVKPRLKRL